MLLLLRSFINGTGGETKMRALNIHKIYMAKYGLTFDGDKPQWKSVGHLGLGNIWGCVNMIFTQPCS